MPISHQSNMTLYWGFRHACGQSQRVSEEIYMVRIHLPSASNDTEVKMENTIRIGLKTVRVGEKQMVKSDIGIW